MQYANKKMMSLFSAMLAFKRVALTRFNLFILFTSLFLGLMIAVLPWWFIGMIAVSIIFLLIGLNYPMLSFLATIAIASNLLPDFLLPSIGFLGGKVPATDFAFLFTALVALFHYQKSVPSFRRAMAGVWKPFVIIIGLFLISMINAYLNFNISIKDTLGESRHLFYWLVLPLTVLISVDEKRFKLVVYGLIAIALLVSVAQIIQGVFGIQVMGGRQVEDLETLGHYSNVKRSIPSGIHLVVWGFIFLIIFSIYRRVRLVFLTPLILIAAAGILLSYGRMIWAGTFLALVIVLYKVGIKYALRTMVMLTMFGVLGLALGAILKPEIITNAYDRIFSVNNEVRSGQSLAWRFYENKLAMQKIEDNPLVGIGLGAAYRPPARSDVTPEQIRYVHNAYLFMILKMGIPVFVMFILFVFQLSKRVNDLTYVKDPFIASFALVTMSILFEFFITCLTQPELMQTPGVSFIAALFGLTIAGNFLNNQNSKTDHDKN